MGKPAKAIMIQGTMSNVGKSLLTAGLCRIFRQDGYRVAPFKSQNMALNSFVTEDGLEIGRAQAMQCEAAGIPPSVWVNPVLLKPTSEKGSQVIVLGKSIGPMDAASYFSYKKQLIPTIRQAYDILAEEYDILVLEGAGSPAEINLKQGDIVNMGMAQMAKAPVLLVGDIDRGGVFASLAGTLSLLDESERPLVKGTIINRFRGDPALLRPGLHMLEDLTRIPVLGVVPYLPLHLDAEDSLSFHPRQSGQAALDLVVIRFPHLSNDTDFAPLERLETVRVRYVSSVLEWGHPDAILLPGTKSTLSDLRWMRETGLGPLIQAQAARGVPVFGICGGYQMLGKQVDDPYGEDGGGSLPGMGLLPTCTQFAREKTTRRTKAVCRAISGAFGPLSGVAAEGYEIHMGQTYLLPGANPFLQTQDGQPEGAFQDTVAGTYLHGIFDRAGFTEAFLSAVWQAKGMPPKAFCFGAQDTAANKEQQFDHLAQALRDSLDLPAVYRILEEGIV